MNIDIRTLVLAETLVSLVQVAVLLFHRHINRAQRGQGWMALGNLLLAIGYLLIYVRDLPEWPRFAVVGLAGAFVLGMTAVCAGILVFLEDVRAIRWILILDAAVISASFLFGYVRGDLATFRLIFALGLAVVSIVAGSALFRKRKRQYRSSALALSTLFFAYGIIFLGKVLFSLAMAAIGGEIHDPPYTQTSFTLVGLFFGSLSTFGFIIMVNQRLNEENIEARERLEIIFNTSPDAVLITRSEDGLVVAANEAFSLLSGHALETVVGATILELGIWARREDRRAFVDELTKKGRCTNREFEYKRKNGESLIGMTSARLFTLDGRPHILSVTHDISNRIRVEEALRESEARFRELADLLPQIVFETDIRGDITYINRQAYQLCGYDPSENAIGMKATDFYLPEDRERLQETMKAFLDGSQEGGEEFRLLRKDGSSFPVLLYASPILHDNRHRGYRGLIIDITERKKYEEEIARLARQLELERNYAQANARTDGLTRLANRRHFDEVLRADFFRLRRTDAPLSLIMLDVDFFKDYNDRYGHLAGDECLKRIAEVLKRIVGRAHDTVARYGGEEFAVILPETGRQGSYLIAERIRNEIFACDIAHEGSSASPNVTVSVGLVTLSPSQVVSPDKVIELADSALYEAKRLGRNRTERAAAKLVETAISAESNLVRLVWSANDESGADEIDAGHRSLFESSNRLLDAVIRGGIKEECLPLFESLLEDVRVHFAEEEEILRQRQFPNVEEHASRHSALANRAAVLTDKYRRDEANIGELFSFFVYEIIAQHLLMEDKKFFPYVADN